MSPTVPQAHAGSEAGSTIGAIAAIPAARTADHDAIAPAVGPCTLNAWCTGAAGHTEGCYSGEVGLQLPGAREAILRADITDFRDPEMPGPQLVFENVGDWPIVTPAELRKVAALLREHAPRLERLADQYEQARAEWARQEVQRITAEMGAVVEEFDPQDLALGEKFHGWYAEISGKPVFVFPQHQDPVQRLQIARLMLAQLAEHPTDGAR